MTPHRLVQALGLAAFLMAGRAAAQQPAAAAVEPAPTTTAPAANTCLPACRDGFTCVAAKCVSLCNPACPEGLECVQGRRCEPPLPRSESPRVYEPPPPPARSFENRSHTLLGFHLGLPGNVDRDGQETALATTLGFNVRGDAPIATYVLLGPLLQLGAWSPDASPELDNSYYVDLDLVLRLRLPITTPKLNYQLWVGMPVGITLNVLGEDAADADAMAPATREVAGVGLGWNIGALLGGAVHFTPKFGLFGELGFLQHKLTHEAEGGQDLDFALRQWCFNLGIVVKN